MSKKLGIIIAYIIIGMVLAFLMLTLYGIWQVINILPKLMGV